MHNDELVIQKTSFADKNVKKLGNSDLSQKDHDCNISVV